jgi:hypothetical protein
MASGLYLRKERTYQPERGPETGIVLAPIVLISGISGDDERVHALHHQRINSPARIFLARIRA